MGDNPLNTLTIAYMEDENEVIDSPTDPVTETEETPAEGESNDNPEVDVDKLQATNKRLFERAKKAEADLKALRGNKPAEASPVSPQPSVEETVLLANGMSDELLTELKAVAKARGVTSLIKAQADPIFVAVKEKFEKDQKQKDASLPASRGSGSVKPKKDFTTPGLSREEHMKMVADTR